MYRSFMQYNNYRYIYEFYSEKNLFAKYDIQNSLLN